MNSEFLYELVNNPKESLSLELKNWIDPEELSGIEKLVKAILAFYNHNGGYLLIGFVNSTGKPDLENAPNNVNDKFHIDKIQNLVSKYSSESFEIKVHFPVIQDKTFVVIEIPAGVRNPVATKSQLEFNGKTIIQINKVYIRSLNSNNTPSTTEATWKDWSSIVEKCFENREADIGRFIRRHLTSIENNNLKEFFNTLSNQKIPQKQNSMDYLKEFISQSRKQYSEEMLKRNKTLYPHGTYEIAAKINGIEKDYSMNQDFLNLIFSSNNHYTGWPMWIDSRSFVEESNPYVKNGFWEALILPREAPKLHGHLDYWRFSPKGEFYLRRGIEDDFRDNTINKTLDISIVIFRIAESLLVLLDFAQAFEAINSENINILFHWTSLDDRYLTSWARSSIMFTRKSISKQDEIEINVQLPIETARSAIGNYVYRVASSLFEIFQGASVSRDLVEDVVKELLGRRNLP
ncbi:transcriptional regulator [Leptospira ellinghausenii]|uniref:Transcriptional regulator n=1 Tax=Leptospira ellinghausenii TaxID=1917822 RepID=A0A2P2DJ27_9LEPT|nr:ATP-binding protein [Leptospira ellinghausenii]GBF44614.1 transcriptional regulator [Leptospira ellinghausenii]